MDVWKNYCSYNRNNMEYGVSVPVEMCVMFIHMCHSHYKVQTCLLYNAKSLLFCRSLKRKH